MTRKSGGDGRVGGREGEDYPVLLHYSEKLQENIWFGCLGSFLMEFIVGIVICMTALLLVSSEFMLSKLGPQY